MSVQTDVVVHTYNPGNRRVKHSGHLWHIRTLQVTAGYINTLSPTPPPPPGLCQAYPAVPPSHS